MSTTQMTNLFGMTKNDALQKGMQNRTRFLEVVQKLPEFKEGDKIYFDYVPSKGVKIYKNGDLKGTIAGLDFKKALFAIWLGTFPAQESLKNEMLGKE